MLAVADDHQQATIKHEEIKGLMAGMTMTFKVKDPQLLSGIEPGDLINATLVVEEDGAHMSTVKKVGEAPLEKAPAPTAASGFELLKPGEAVPDAQFVDQDGKARAFSSFKGSPLAITFIYTKCPIPDFCPLMDRQFAAIQQTLKTDPRAAEGPSAQRQLRPGDRHPGRAQDTCGAAEGRSRRGGPS